MFPLVNNNSNLGSASNIWKNHFVVDLSVNTVNGAAYSAGGGGSSYVITSIGSDIPPSITNTYSLGSTSRYWNNAYINNLRASNRAYQEISGDISWSAVNGHYGLAKDAYPGLNPSSSGVKVVQTWISRTVPVANEWSGICWSPELGLFVAIAWGGSNNRVMTSPNGITWTARFTADANAWRFVCWSPQLRLFVAIAYSGTNRVMTSPDGITWTGQSQGIEANSWRAVCWSPELGLFAAISDDGNNRAMTSPNGITWTPRTTPETNGWISICWSPELGLFVAVGSASVSVVMTSNNGINWTARTVSGANAYTWHGVCWSKELGLFVGVAHGGNRVLTSNNGINWSMIILPFSNNNSWTGVCWSGELELFVAIAQEGTNRVMTSPDGINWTSRTAVESMYWYGICWSPELGIFAAVAWSGASQVMTSSLKGRPPTSYNVFDSSFNSISETGTWSFANVVTTGTLTVNTTPYNSDDRLKHNEVVITNGLTIIDQLTPKFYQKTFTMLDASYNGDLSGLTWTYEAGLIAQEVLRVPELSFVVGGGDYYYVNHILRSKLNPPSYPPIYYEQKMNYDLSFAISYYQQKMNTDLSFDASYNIQQIFSDLIMDPSYNILKMNNDLIFDACYNEQKIISDLSSQDLSNNDLSNSDLSNTDLSNTDLSNSDLSYSYYYELSNNVIAQPYTLNYNSVFVYGLAAIKELHAKVKTQESSLLSQQTIINTLTTRMEALETDPSNS
jgi:hypothetical protein